VRTAVEGVFTGLVLMGQWVGEVFAAVWDGIANWDFASIGTRIEEINVDYGRLFDGLNEKVEEEGAFAAEQFTRAWNDYNALDAEFIVQQEWAEIYASQGAEAAQAFLDSAAGGVTDGEVVVSNAVGYTMQRAVDQANERARNGITPGMALADGIATGVTNNTDGVIASAEAAVQSAVNASAGDATAGGQSIGQNLGEGIAEGISWADWAIRQSATSAVRRALAAAQGAAEIQSPSRLFRREVGKHIGDGIALGITDAAPGIETAAAAAIPQPASIDWSGTMLDGSGGGGFGGASAPLVGALTMVSHGDTREDMDDVAFALRNIKRGGR
jgi:hypothetical protein